MSDHDSTSLEGRSPALQLIPVIPKGGTPGPSVKMQWCISDETIRRLAELEVRRPYLLVVVTNGQHEMSRQLFSLHQGERFVRFFTPGTNVVHATIVWLNNAANPSVKIFKRDDDGSYQMDVVEPRTPKRFSDLTRQIGELRRRVRNAVDDAELIRLQNAIGMLKAERDELSMQEYPPGLRSFSSISRLGEAVIDIEIDPDHFATEKDNLWLTRELAGLFRWDSKPVDPCHVRRRALFTAASLPLLAVLLVGGGLSALAVVAAYNLVAAGFLLLLGARGINFAPVFRPWKVHPIVIWENADSSIWFSKKLKTTDSSGHLHTAMVPRPFLVQALAPPILTLWVGVFLGLWYGTSQQTAYAEGIGFLAYVLIAVGAYLPVSVRKRHERQARARQAKGREPRRHAQRLMHELDAVSCSALAEGRMPRPSFALRFEGVKAMVCQPFAKRPN